MRAAKSANCYVRSLFEYRDGKTVAVETVMVEIAPHMSISIEFIEASPREIAAFKALAQNRAL